MKMSQIGKTFSNISLQNGLLNFPGIKVEEAINDKPRKVTEYHFCRSIPKIRNTPHLSGLSQKAIQMLGLDYERVKESADTALYLSGSKIVEGSKPIASNYCGYQFGNWAGQLGDGRAHIIGNLKNGSKSYELQLKGSGITPFSRHADGNSVVSSAARQFLASQLMFGLGIPTTRAASLVISEDLVKRDPFYNGQIKIEKAAIVLRVCESFLRFGNLQICNEDAQMRKQTPLENRKILQPLCDYLLSTYYTDIDGEEQDPYEQMYQKIVKESAELVANWQSIGFCHGVLNTDNMSLINVTIDYGPFAFIDYFSKDFVSNATDQYERYSFRRQSEIVKWNLERLAESLDVLVPHKLLLKYLNQNFNKFYEQKYYELMSKKIGLEFQGGKTQIIDQMIENMHTCNTNYTNFFRIFEEINPLKENKEKMIDKILTLSCPNEFYLKNLRVFPQLLNAKWQNMLEHDTAFNKFFVIEQKSRIQMHKRLQLESCKQRTIREKEIWSKWLDSYFNIMDPNQKHQICNVKYVLLNQIAKMIIEDIAKMDEKEQLNHFEKLLKVFHNPYEYNEEFEQRYWRNLPTPVRLTCSS